MGRPKIAEWSRRGVLGGASGLVALAAIGRGHPAAAEVAGAAEIPVVDVWSRMAPGSLHLDRGARRLFFVQSPGRAALFDVTVAGAAADLPAGSFVTFRPGTDAIALADRFSGETLVPRLAPEGDFALDATAFDALLSRLDGPAPGVVYG